MLNSMKRVAIVVVLGVLAAALAVLYLRGRSPEPVVPSADLPPILNNSNMLIASAAFERNSSIPKKNTCVGENVNPPLTFSGVPENAKSLSLIMDDPDAPRGTWVHWTMWNIDPSTINISVGSVPAGAVEGTTSSGKSGYGGPCPPSGTHHYYFKLYALDTTLNLNKSLEKQGLESAMEGHVLGQAELVGLYSRE